MDAVKRATLALPTESSGRLQVLDELRGLAILLILTYHIGGVTGFPNRMHGELGVDIFLLMSGAVLALNHNVNEGAWKFLWRRLALRLLPAYWIVLTVYWLGGVKLLNRIHTNTDIISHYLCIHPWWGDKYFLGINDSFWFLGLIVPLYFAYAALRRLLPIRPDIVIGGGLIISFGLTCLTFFVLGQPSVFIHLGLRPSIFFVGILFGLMLRRGGVQMPLSPWLGIGVLVSLYGLFVTGTLVGYTMAGFSIFVAYYAMRTSATSAAGRPLCRGLAWIGIYSYEIFLIHQPIIRDYNHYFWNIITGRIPNQIELALGIIVALFFTLLLSVLLHHIVGKLAKILSPSKTC